MTATASLGLWMSCPLTVSTRHAARRLGHRMGIWSYQETFVFTVMDSFRACWPQSKQGASFAEKMLKSAEKMQSKKSFLTRFSQAMEPLRSDTSALSRTSTSHSGIHVSR
jgi:hypothetical protein